MKVKTIVIIVQHFRKITLVLLVQGNQTNPKNRVTTVSVIVVIAHTSAFTSIALSMAHKGGQVMQEGHCLAEHVSLPY